jgi:O-antigen/teichoic acid export membrane protein
MREDDGNERSGWRGVKGGLVAGGALVVLSRLAGLFGGLWIMVVLTRYLGAAEYGRYAVGMVVLNWSAGVAMMMLGGAVVPLVAGREDGDCYAVTMYRAAVVSGLVLALVLVGSAEWVERVVGIRGLGTMMRVVALDAVPGAAALVNHGVVVARGKVGWGAGIPLIGVLVQLAGVMGAVVAGGGAEWAVVAYAGSSVVQFVVGRLVSGVRLTGCEGVRFVELWHRTGRLAGAQLMTRVLQSLDLPAVRRGCGSDQVAGWYAGAQNIGAACVMVFFPIGGQVQRVVAAARWVGREGEAAAAACGFVRVALVFGGLVVISSVYAREIMVMFLGDGFGSGGELLAVLMWTAAFRILGVAGRVLLAVAGENGVQVVILAVVSVVGGCAYVVLVPRYGAGAAAAVSVVLAAVAAGVSLREAGRRLGMVLPWRTALRVVVAGGVAAAGGLVVPSGIHVLVRLVVLTLMYGMVLVVLGEVSRGGVRDWWCREERRG